MEKKLKNIFDYHRFEQNEALERLIRDTESRYGTALTEEELDLVFAAGEPEILEESQKMQERRPAEVCKLIEEGRLAEESKLVQERKAVQECKLAQEPQAVRERKQRVTPR